MKEIGTRLSVMLPDEYAEVPGVPVAAEVVEVPFRPSVNPNSREVARKSGRDFAY
jgi:aminomethyltransferase